MKTVIGVPCLEMVHTSFFASMMRMRTVGEINLDIKKGSLTFDSRNEIVVDAIVNGADRILMIDSDMRFDPDLMERFIARLDEGYDMVCGLFFKRVIPTMPVIYKVLQPPILKPDGTKVKRVEEYADYPPDTVFEVQGCGFGAVMMTTELAKTVWDELGEPPFTPLEWCGEDMAFCYRVQQIGRKMWCDSSIKVGHIGSAEFGEKTWISQVAAQAQVKLSTNCESGQNESIPTNVNVQNC